MTVTSLTPATEIALSALVASKNNVRHIKSDVSVEDLAEDIARRGLLQSLTVHAVRDESGNPTGAYAVTAGGRRFAALKWLAVEGRLSEDAPIPCIIRDTTHEAEDSLAENVMREALHPLDQFRAFKALSEEENLSIEEIAARFFVSPHIVRQRLKLAAASPKLLVAYEAGALTLDQLMAFCVTGDHARQEQIFEQIQQGHNNAAFYIRRLITEGAVKGNDRRVLYVGSEHYEAAGGVILRDLFTDDDGGWYQNVALLDRLAAEKLAEDVKTIKAEGWNWIETAVQFPYGHCNGLTRLTSIAAPVTEEEQARYDAAVAEYNALSEDYDGEDELPEEVDVRLGELEAEMALIDERPALFKASEIGHAGVFVSIEHDGRLRIERGFVRPEDRAALRAATATSGELSGMSIDHIAGSSHATVGDDVEDAEGVETAPRLSDRLVAELTAHRTLALREAVAETPDTALLAMTHALALKTFYRLAGSDTCLEVELRSASLASHAPEIGETDLAARMDQRQARWATMLPTNPGDLWNALVGFDPDSLAGLFAFCVASSVNAVEMPHIRRKRELTHANALVSHVGLDMKRYWTATAKSFFGKVTKAQILGVVREVKGEAVAQMIDHLKKADMTIEAERLMSGSNWLPDPLRATQDAAPVNAAPAIEIIPTQMGDQDAEEAGDAAEKIELPAFLTEALAQSPSHAIAAE